MTEKDIEKMYEDFIKKEQEIKEIKEQEINVNVDLLDLSEDELRSISNDIDGVYDCIATLGLNYEMKNLADNLIVNLSQLWTLDEEIEDILEKKEEIEQEEGKKQEEYENSEYYKDTF